MSSSPSTGAQTARTVTADAAGKRGLLDVSSLVLLAVLLASGVILNLTAGNALAVVGGIKPQFVIAAYALAILLMRAGAAQSLVFGLVSAAVITAAGSSVPGLNFLTEAAGALTMCAASRLDLKVGGRSVTPLIAAFLATLVSGALFACVGTLLQGYVLTAALVKAPVVLGTAVFNAVVVQALYFPLRAALKRK